MTKFVVCHHGEQSVRSLGESDKKYWGLTRNGVTQIREKTKILIKAVENAPNGSAIILGGRSKAVRTRSTLKVFIDELRQIFKDEKGIVFSQPFNSETPLEALNAIKGLEEISRRSHDNRRKVIVDFPLTIEEFISLQGQRECTVAKRLLGGLFMAEGFFRRFLPPGNPLILISAGHSKEIAALMDFLHKKNGNGRVGDKVDFCFM